MNTPGITEAPVQDWYFTFGWGHTDPQTGEDMKNGWIRVTGTFDAARRYIFGRFGDKWAFQYGPGQLNPQFYPEGEFEHITLTK